MRVGKRLKGTKSCAKKPNTKITGYSRCRPGRRGNRRTTSEERRSKRCNSGEAKIHVGGHHRKVCKRAKAA